MFSYGRHGIDYSTPNGSSNNNCYSKLYFGFQCLCFIIYIYISKGVFFRYRRVLLLPTVISFADCPRLISFHNNITFHGYILWLPAHAGNLIYYLMHRGAGQHVQVQATLDILLNQSINPCPFKNNTILNFLIPKRTRTGYVLGRPSSAGPGWLCLVVFTTIVRTMRMDLEKEKKRQSS